MQAGEKHNMLTAIEKVEVRNGKSYWSFKCDCGNIKTIYATNVANGHVKSCGCLSKKPDLSIVGQTFNNLKVLEYTEETNNYGRKLYRCQCLLCGGERMATRENLIRGEIKDCGCTRHNLKESSALIGQKIGKLNITGTKVINNKTRLICKCDCGNTKYVLPGDIKSGKVRSCGCLIGEKAKELYVDGTAPCKLDGSKIRCTNTSGVTGVWFSRSKGLWVAEIMFKRKKYYLGSFVKKETAIEVRKKAENRIFGEFLEWYEEFKSENFKEE